MPRQFVPSGSMITCTVASGEVTDITATNSTVTIYGENWLTTQDNIPNTNFKPFPSCSSKCMVGCPSIKGEWETPASDQILSNKKKLLANDSTLECGVGGTISLVMQCVGDMVDPPNAIDKLKETLNNTFKAVVKKVEAIQSGVAGTIATTVGNVAAPVTAVINNEAVQNALKTGKGYLDKAQELKNTVDGYIETADTKSELLSDYIEEQIGDREAIATDIVTDATDSLQQELDELLNNVDDVINKNLDEIKNGVTNIGNSVINASPEFTTLLNLISEVQRAGETVKENPEGPLYQVDENSTSNVSNPHKIDPTKPHSFQVDTGKLDELKEQLGAQTQEIRDELSAEIAKLEALIEKYSLNNYLQDKIDEEIERRIEKAKKESKDVQTDIDRASTLLSGLGNEYNDFVSGISNELIAKFNSKIDPKLLEAQEKLKKANANLATAATALNGAKFIVGGMPAGLVVTKAKKKKKKGDKDGIESAAEIVGPPAPVPAAPAAPAAGELLPEVSVEFRPGSNEAEFGFDWIRTGDTGGRTDNPYNTIMGTYAGNSFTASNANFPNLEALFDTSENHPTIKGQKYYTPELNLLVGKTAKLKLLLTINKVVNKIELDFDATYFQLNLNNIPPGASPVGAEHTNYPTELEIKCIKEIPSTKYIKILADTKFAGQIKINPNTIGNRRKTKIVFVRVKTDLAIRNGSFVPNNPVTGSPAVNSEIVVKNSLQQALCRASSFAGNTLPFVTLDLSLDHFFNNSFAPTNSFDYNLISQRIRVGTKWDYPFENYLNVQMNSVNNSHLNIYNDYYKVYFFDELVITAEGILNGLAFNINNPKKSVVVFKSGGTDTVIHELFHAMGLYHSFANKGDFTYQKIKTDNIMDYTTSGAINNGRRILTWNWQWKILQNNLDRE